MSLLITGSTGFLGNGLLYLLDKQNYSNNIYLLIRTKREKSASMRFQEIKQQFQNLQLILLETELLSISKVKLYVEIVINLAASVSFNSELKEALNNNVDSVIEILKFINNNNIPKFIHVSTAYVSCINKNDTFTGSLISNKITEKYVNCKAMGNINTLYENIKNDKISFEEIIQKKWFPNTYCLTKCLAEKMIEKEIKHNKKINITIIRPSIITNAIETPYLGWFKGYNAAIGFHSLIQHDYVKYIICNRNTKLDYVPVDYVCHIIVDSFQNQKNIIKHATSFFKILSIQQLVDYVDKKSVLFENKCFYTHYLKYSIIVRLSLYIILFYFLSFVNIDYLKKVKQIQRLFDTCININDIFKHFLTTSYNFKKSYKLTTPFITYVDREQYYIKILRKM